MIRLRLRYETTPPHEGVLRTGFLREIRDALLPTVRYLFSIESHVYALAIAAAVLLSFFPFMVLILSVTHNLLHWPFAADVLLAGLREYLPRDPGLIEFVIRNLQAAVQSRGRTEALSLILLLFGSNGIFVPLEVAQNRLWRFAADRPYWRNQLLSFSLAFVCGGLVLCATLIASQLASSVHQIAGQSRVLAVVSDFLAPKLAALPCSILILLLIYWVLPNGRISVRRVAPVAVWGSLVLEIAKNLYLVLWPLLDFRRAYGPFFISVTLLIWGYLAAMIVLAGAEVAARSGVGEPEASCSAAGLE